MIFRRIALMSTLSLFAFYSLSFAFWGELVLPKTQQASVLESITNFFKSFFVGDENNNNSNNYEQSKVFQFSELSQSVENTTENNMLNVNTSDTFYNKDKHMLCIPSDPEKGEEFLLWFRCPSGYSMEENNFDANSNYGLIKLTASESKTYNMKCKKLSNEYTDSCKIEILDPKITSFSITPSNPQDGQEIIVKWDTQDMSRCVLLSEKQGVLSGARFGEVTTNAEKNDTIKLYCKSKNGLKTIEKKINI